MKILLFATLFYASAAFGEIAAWQRACKAGDTQACMEAGKYFTDMARTQAYYEKAAQMYKIACDKDAFEACGKLGALYAQGLGVKKDAVKARELFKKACDGGDKAGCDRYGEFKERD
jgi:sel1 repeat-containing domain protein